MKKHLIAAAVAAAVVAPAAMAQQVTIDGNMDLAFTSATKVDDAGTTSAVTAGTLYTSFLRLQGTEDLGGGLKASFVLATNIGAVTNDGPTGNNFSFGDRGAELTLSGGFGSIGIGKAATSDANAVDSGPTNLTNFGTIKTNARPSNRVIYTTPSIQGFTANVAYATNSKNGSAESKLEDTQDDGKYSSIGLAYTSGPLSARVFQAKVDNDAAGTDPVTTTDRGASLSYNFGIVAASLRYIQTEDDANTFDNSTYGLDLIAPLGNGLRLGVGYFSTSVDKTANSDYNRTVAYLMKDLSKRTMVYAAYGRSDNDSAAAFGAGIGAGAPVKGQNQSGYAVGVRHQF
jgi:predicted porin